MDFRKENMLDIFYMYDYVDAAALEKGMIQTFAALPVMKELHAGQIRKGPVDIPYIVHPLTMACHALAMGIEDDDIIATTLLHDVVEDCDVTTDELPVGGAVAEALELLTFSIPEGKTWDEAKAIYYDRLQHNRIASIVKIIDRCNNVSDMAFGFTDEKIAKYIKETETYILPLIEKVRREQPEMYNALFILHYQIVSFLRSMKARIAK